MSMKKLFPVAVTLVIGAAAGVVLSASDRGSDWFLSPPFQSTYDNEDSTFAESQSAMADFDGDGLADWAFWKTLEVDGINMMAVYVKRGYGTGDWATRELVELVDLTGGYSNDNTVAADVNGDGWTDLVISIKPTSAQHHLITFFNSSGNGFSCAGDVTGDGETGVKDILTVIDDWGCNQGDPLD